MEKYGLNFTPEQNGIRSVQKESINKKNYTFVVYSWEITSIQVLIAKFFFFVA